MQVSQCFVIFTGVPLSDDQ